MPEVPNDGTRLTSETAAATDTTLSTPALALQAVEIQTNPVEAELIGVPVVAVSGG